MKKLTDLFFQLLRFGAVGVICFLIDYLLMLLLTEACGVAYLLSCGISFTVSAVVNYVLSMRFVFSRTVEMDRRVEFLLFFLMSAVGLVLTELLMLLFVESFTVHYALAKIVVTAIVMAYNFISRKLLFERKRKNG
ncbi:MAG: GtrA family protein [Clostridia bacterium]|nr:GtrA family protein [Clostridia bacterium]